MNTVWAWENWLCGKTRGAESRGRGLIPLRAGTFLCSFFCADCSLPTLKLYKILIIELYLVKQKVILMIV
jgi:hypothetical protein